jgi:hypothetical protein
MLCLGDFFEGRVILIVFSVTNKAKKNMFISDLPTDPNIFYAKNIIIIDRQNPEIRLRFRVCFQLQQ